MVSAQGISFTEHAPRPFDGDFVANSVASSSSGVISLAHVVGWHGFIAVSSEFDSLPPLKLQTPPLHGADRACKHRILGTRDKNKEFLPFLGTEIDR